MVQLEQLKYELSLLKEPIEDLRVSLDIDKLTSEIKELDEKAMEPAFWDDPKNAQKILQKSKQLKDKLNRYEALSEKYEELNLLLDMAIEEKDLSVEKEVQADIEKIKEEIDTIRVETLLSGEYDKNNAIISIHAGAGGLDAQDWAEMLLRMYTRWAEKKGYRVKTLDILPDTEAGIKNVTLLIEGENAYGYLKCERGVHRIVRISPFDPSGKRHTSFASLDVMPELDEDIEIDINPNDLRIDTYRASGAGGQHVNKTDSAIRITHIPTGIVVQCQNERSQHSNRETAMKMLISKLIEIKEREHKDKIEDLKGDYSQIAWGSQIRSYVFHPYNMVKDHRTNAEVGNVQAVMDGEIDLFINEYLKKEQK
ncbi:peptide chain release factor 2 [Crassaminicella thermophila]|uniref:Peptide chain release factor 2 n=1 Tax=Crassaminicella thermophila TaxID=2599308 RepID=A0A5C0SDL4_CRATE|nr:peptide chain release factor 2 [Crassaminicella thermophila]QEK11334.1 peptide chain release factor 2 [Crassaminicella thermophila]